MKLIDGKYGTKYWDLFEQRIEETVFSIKNQTIPKLRRISLHITNKCNFNCIYCNEIHKNKELDFNLFKRIVDEYSEMGGGILHITGGEPSIVSYINEAIDYSHSKGIITNLNTNGYKRFNDSSYSKMSRLKISFDTNDENRFDNLVRHKGAFNNIIDNIKYIKTLKNYPVISLTYTVNAQNIEDMIPFINFYYKEIRVYAIFFSIYKGDNPNLIFSQENINRLFHEVYPKIKEIMIKNNDYDSLWLLENSHSKMTYELQNRFPENNNTPCYLSLSELSIYENGEISHCSHLSRDGIFDKNLNIKDNALQEIMNKKLDLLNKIPLNQKCLYGCNLKLCKFNLECKKKLNKI